MPARRPRTLLQRLTPLLLALLVVVQPGLAAARTSGAGCTSACCCVEPADAARTAATAPTPEPAGCCSARADAPARPETPLAADAARGGCGCMALPEDGGAPPLSSAAQADAGAVRERLARALAQASLAPTYGVDGARAEPAPPPERRARRARTPHDAARRLSMRGVEARLALHGIARR